MTFNPADAATVPPEVRRHALRLALEAVDGYLRQTGYAFDFFGRLELLDLALDELEAEYDTNLPEPRPSSDRHVQSITGRWTNAEALLLQVPAGNPASDTQVIPASDTNE